MYKVYILYNSGSFTLDNIKNMISTIFIISGQFNLTIIRTTYAKCGNHGVQLKWWKSQLIK